MRNLILFKSLCLNDSFAENSSHPDWIISNKCRFCKELLSSDSFTTGFTYWKAMLFACHSECKSEGIKTEVMSCQTIDSDCNDCRHFIRGKMIQSGVASIWEGTCKKFNKPMRAYPNFCSGHECFEHRNEVQHERDY